MTSPDHPFYKSGVKIPRFLFRGFNRFSGGGITGLNHSEGVTPYGHFLNWDSTNQVDRQMKPKWLQARVRMHLCQSDSHPTPFSSWSHDWRTALAFAIARCVPRGSGESYRLVPWNSHIAVLDTWTLGDKNMLQNKIFHVSQFDIPDIHSPCEWLIWGTVHGAAYRGVPLATIRQATLCPAWPNHTFADKLKPSLLEKEICDSMLVAGCFQRRGDDSADVLLAVAAAELARRFWGRNTCIYADGDPETIFETEPLWPRYQLQELLDVFARFNPVLSGRPLVHGNTAVEGFPRVSLMYDLLQGAETRWRNNDAGTRWVRVDFSQWQELCKSCIERGYY